MKVEKKHQKLIPVAADPVDFNCVDVNLYSEDNSLLNFELSIP